MKHTKGVWEVHGNGIFPQGKPGNICVASKQNFGLNPNGTFKEDLELEANAKLIAAAPELLEAIQSALNIVDLWGAGQYGTKTPSEMHKAEMQALALMEMKFKEAIKKATV